MFEQPSYYGRIESSTPHKKVHNYMLDEHIKQSIDLALERLKKEFNDLGRALKLDVKEEIQALKKKVRLFEEKMATLPKPELMKQKLKDSEESIKNKVKKNLKAKGYKVD